MSRERFGNIDLTLLDRVIVSGGFGLPFHPPDESAGRNGRDRTRVTVTPGERDAGGTGFYLRPLSTGGRQR